MWVFDMFVGFVAMKMYVVIIVIIGAVVVVVKTAAEVANGAPVGGDNRRRFGVVREGR